MARLAPDAPKIAEAGVRCPNAECGQKIAEEVVGYFRATCRRCGSPIVVVRAASTTIEFEKVRVAVNVRVEMKRSA